MKAVLVLITGLLVGAPAVAQYTPPAPAGIVRGVEPPAESQGPEISLSLPEAVALGLRQNRSIRSAYLNRVVQKFQLDLDEDLFVPKLNSIGLSASRDWTARRVGGTTITDSTSLTPQGSASWALPTGGAITATKGMSQTTVRGPGATKSGASSWHVGISQPLLKGAGLDIGMAPLRLTRLTEKSNILALKRTVSGIVTDIIAAYYTFIGAHQNAMIARNGLERARGLLDVNQALIAAGRMADNEIFQTETSVANQELSLLAAEDAFLAARLQLNTLLALPLDTRIIPAEEIRAEPLQVDLALARNLALENNPDYLGQIIALERARIDLMVTENQELWDVSLTAGRTYNQDGRTAWEATRSKPETTTSSVGLTVTIPLDRRPAQLATLSSKIAVQEAEWALDDRRESLDKGVQDAVRDVGIRWRQLELARRARGLAEQSLDVEMIKLRNGRTTNFQVLSVEDSLRAAETAELAAVTAYLNALATLDQQLGTTLDTWSISLND